MEVKVVMVAIAVALALCLAAGIVVMGARRKAFGLLYWRRLFVVSLLLLVAVAAGLLPIRSADTAEVIANTDYVFIVDTTYSMNAVDGRGGGSDSRLNDVRSDIKTFADKLPGSRFGIITYDTQTSIYLPLTATTADVDEAADTLNTTAYSESVSDPSMTKGLQTTAQYLAAAAKVDPTRQRVVVLMTDGELTGAADTQAGVQNAAKQLARSVNASVIIGYGSDAGAKMPVLELDSNLDALQAQQGEYAFNSTTGGDAVSKRDENFLHSITTTLGGAYIAEQNAGALVPALASARGTAARRQSHNAANVALQQNALHVPLALAITAWLFAVEIWGLRPVRRALANWRRHA